MTYEQVRAYQKELKAQGKTASTSKEYGKTEDYIKTLKPENYSKDQVSSAYTSLSSGVTKTGGWTEKNLDKITAATGKTPQLNAPKNAEALPSYLSGYQDTVFGASNNPAVRDSIINQIEPDTAKPDPISRVDTFNSMRESMGVSDMEKNLTDLKAQLETEVATTRARKTDAEGKPVAMGVIAGRVSEVERQQNERVDAITRQINTVTDQLNTSYNVISTYTNLMGLDYQDAVTAYNTDFSRNLEVYKLMDAEQDEAVANARANLTTFQNAIISGNVNYSSLPSASKSLITKLEVQAGLPVGFTASLKSNETVLYSGTRESGGTKYLDIITKDSKGQPTTKTISLGASGTSGTTEADKLKAKSQDMNASLSGLTGADGKVSPSTWAKGMRGWVAEGGTEEDYKNRFGSFVNKSYDGWFNDYEGFNVKDTKDYQ